MFNNSSVRASPTEAQHGELSCFNRARTVPRSSSGHAKLAREKIFFALYQAPNLPRRFERALQNAVCARNKPPWKLPVAASSHYASPLRHAMHHRRSPTRAAAAQPSSPGCRRAAAGRLVFAASERVPAEGSTWSTDGFRLTLGTYDSP
jgi:hypothetical protein